MSVPQSSRPNVLLWTMVLTIASLTLILFVRDYHIRIFSRLEGFKTRHPFALMDSLPALSGGLSNLEAFKLSVDASSATNNDRSVWLSNSLADPSIEYYSGRSRFDSTTFYLWTSDSLLQSRTLKGSRELEWNLEYKKKIRDWVEVVGVYVSRPKFMEFRSTDSSVYVFERIEGKTLHIVRRRYRDHKEDIVRPDTVYPTNNGGELELLAKGAALAVVNPASDPVRIRIIRIDENRWVNLRVRSHSIQVYRNLLAGNSGPLLAYTNSGKSFPVLFKKDLKTASYFWLDRKNP